MDNQKSFLTGLMETFLHGNLAILFMLVSLVAGGLALYATPREEEPQITVPVADVIVMYPGGSAEEVERMVAARLERMLYQIDGVEYVYSMSRPGMAVVTVRFFVGEDREKSLIKLYSKLQQNLDKVTPGIAGWIVKPIEIDDVPIVNIALYSDRYDTHALYRVAEETVARLQHVEDSGRITIHGGERRVVQVQLDTERLAAYGLSAMEIAQALQMSNVQLASGAFEQNNRIVKVEAGPFLGDVQEVRNLLVGLHGDQPVYLRDVATVQDGPEEATTYSRIGFGPAGASAALGSGQACVTIAVAKKKGSNAVRVARRVAAVMRDLQGRLLPDDVHWRITRDYGATANDKVNNLVMSLATAVLMVIGMIAVSMTWREGLIVAVTVPITYSLSLLFNYLLGYTMNRVTLFALILALGLLVDNPIVSVDNIARHLSLRRAPRMQAVADAMREVMQPIIMATLAIIASFLPMFFITGMMGPYMRPMALNVPLTMLTSMLVAFLITPWLSAHLLKPPAADATPYDVTRTPTYRMYRRLVQPLVESPAKAGLLLAVVAVLFGLSLLLAAMGRVPLKMLPFDNKNEFQVVVDMPEHATLEQTDAVARQVEDLLRTVPEVVDFTTLVGAASALDFNGLVRHYYLRQGPHVADLRVNLLPREKRQADSHALILRLRTAVAAIGRRTGADLKLVESPPGPPVFATVVAEVSGQPRHTYADLLAAARAVRARMDTTPGMVDVDDSGEATVHKIFFQTDREKAGLNGIATADIAQTLRLALDGQAAGTVHAPTEQNELPIVLRLPRERRSDKALLETILVKGRSGQAVALGDLGQFRDGVEDQTIHHKNMERVVYVLAEMAGRGPADAVFELQKHFRAHPLPAGIRVNWRGEGEWKITVDVFRDLGIAFSIALLVIYMLLVYETRSYLLPGIIMMSIPLTLIGILPGFWLLNAIMDRPVGGFANPVFFTATAMIGMIALGGIVVRNAIILIDFIKSSVRDGLPIKEAIIQSGAVRFRPIFLTAGTTLLGSWPITLDPIFSGLAWALIFGLFMSTAFTLIVIPVTYYLVYGRKPAAA